MHPSKTPCIVAGLLAALALSAPLTPAAGDDWNQEAKLLASDGAADDWFHSVCLCGDTALVGAYFDDNNGTDAGSVYIFEKVGTVWTQMAKLTATDGAPDDYFGARVSLFGDTALIGALGDDDLGYNSGSAYVFEKVDGVWTQVAKLTASDGAAYDEFGIRVALWGDTALMAAPFDNDGGYESGSAYIFEKVDGSWTQVAKLTATDGAAYDRFGYSVSLSGDTALIGALGDDDAGYNSGSAYVFEKVDGVWTQVAKLTASDGAGQDEFGCSVSLSSQAALVGAWGDDYRRWDSGSAYIFRKVVGVWVQEAKLLPSDAAPYDYFGSSVSISGDTALVAAPDDDDNGTNSGSAYVFREVGSVWLQEAKLLPADGAPADFFGRSVSVSIDTALVGAWLDDDRGTDSGSAYVFQHKRCPGDLDGDWDTDQADLGILLADWGCTGGDCPGDLDHDGDTDQADLGILLADWNCDAY